MRTRTSTISPPTSQWQRGFTLTEILAVLFILSLAALLIGPRLTLSSAKWDLQRDGQKVASMVREARLQAMAEGERQAITFHPSESTIRTPMDTVILSGATITTVTAEEMNSNEGLPQIIYFPDGSASGGRVSLSKDGNRYTVGVDWLTGIVETRWEPSQ